MDQTAMRKVLLIIPLLLFAEKTFSQNINSLWTVGPTFSYHFDGGGMSYGLQADYFPSQLNSSFWSSTSNDLSGITINLSYGVRDGLYFHAGFERLLGMIFGIDAGPSLTVRDGIHAGFSIIPFAGLLAYGFFNCSWYTSIGFAQSTGLMVKIPAIIPTDNPGL